MATLVLGDDADSRALWPHAYALAPHGAPGRAQRVGHAVGAQPFGAAWPFTARCQPTRVDALDALRLHGLEGCRYWDAVQGPEAPRKPRTAGHPWRGGSRVRGGAARAGTAATARGVCASRSRVFADTVVEPRPGAARPWPTWRATATGACCASRRPRSSRRWCCSPARAGSAQTLTLLGLKRPHPRGASWEAGVGRPRRPSGFGVHDCGAAATAGPPRSAVAAYPPYTRRGGGAMGPRASPLRWRACRLAGDPHRSTDQDRRHAGLASDPLSRPSNRRLLRPATLALSIAAAFGSLALPAGANPRGGVAVHGQASMATLGQSADGDHAERRGQQPLGDQPAELPFRGQHHGVPAARGQQPGDQPGGDQHALADLRHAELQRARGAGQPVGHRDRGRCGGGHGRLHGVHLA